MLYFEETSKDASVLLLRAQGESERDTKNMSTKKQDADPKILAQYVYPSLFHLTNIWRKRRTESEKGISDACRTR